MTPAPTSLLLRLKQWARALKSDLITLWYCQRHPDTPLLAKLISVCVVGYAFSPIDLIPDFIPVLGYLDDLLIVPLGIYVVLRMMPPHVLERSRVLAHEWEAQRQGRPRNWIAAVVIAAIWLLILSFCWQFVERHTAWLSS